MSTDLVSMGSNNYIIWKKKLSIFTSQTDKSCLRDLLVCKCFIGKAKDLVHSVCYQLGLKLLCLVMFVLLVCDISQTTYAFVTCLFFNVFNEIFNDTDYSVSRLSIILKLFIITGSVSCTVLDILRSHSITKTLSLNKLCTT